MRCMGSKARIAKYIIPIMLKERKDDTQFWVEPFVGGGNILDKITGNRIGGDINPWVISGLASVRDEVHCLPKDNTEFTEQDYKELKTSDSYPYKGYAGFSFSFGSKWLAGWSRDAQGVDYVAQAYRSIIKQSPKLQGVQLICSSYNMLDIPENSVIYCDPPYKNTTKYKTENFNHEAFWQWCREKKEQGHTIFISEYNAPEDFTCIWEKPITNNVSKTEDSKYKTATERLFVYNKGK